MTSDHIMNLLEEVGGKLPEDKPKMLAVIRAYQELPDAERLIYRGRPPRRRLPFDPRPRPRPGHLPQDPAPDRRGPQRKEGPAGVERLITEMVDQYI
ncbi:MAG: hypothetical protein MZV70_60650 [Desulfobacterales bacterium]|nr:hypothetical protein [Desulfobacterales bacterium]